MQFSTLTAVCHAPQYAATPFSVDDDRTLLYYYSGGNGPHDGVKTSAGIYVRDDAIARAEGSAYAIAGLAHPDATVMSSVLTQPIRIVDDRPSLWLTFGRNAGEIGVQSTVPVLTVGLQKQGVPLAGLGAAEFVPYPSSCADGAPCRLKILWGQSLSRLVDQEVEIAVTFRGYVIYSVSQE